MVYEVIKKRSVDALQDTVNRRIVEGYRPIGGLAIIQSPVLDELWFYQAMIRDEKPRPNGDDDR